MRLKHLMAFFGHFTNSNSPKLASELSFAAYSNIYDRFFLLIDLTGVVFPTLVTCPIIMVQILLDMDMISVFVNFTNTYFHWNIPFTAESTAFLYCPLGPNFFSNSVPIFKNDILNIATHA